MSGRKARFVKTVREGALKLDIFQYFDGDYGFDWYVKKGDRDRVRRKELAVAEKKARELMQQGTAGVLDHAHITTEEYRAFTRWKSGQTKSKPVPVVVANFMASKRSKGRSEMHLYGLEKNLEKLAGAFSCNIDQLTRESAEKWLDGFKDIGPRRWNNLLADVVALIRFARRDGLVPVEISGPEKIERKTVVLNIQTYTPEEYSRLLGAAEPQWLPVLVFGGLCGLRTAEVAPGRRLKKPGLHWEQVNWDERKILVSAEISKDRRKRYAPLTDAAFALLSDRRNESGPIAPPLVPFDHYVKRRLEVVSGVKWKPNALRHSFASYRLAVQQDTAALALELGNSPAMIFRHYLDLKLKKDGLAWFSVAPKLPEEKLALVGTF